jgi:hypothetical protein
MAGNPFGFANTKNAAPNGEPSAANAAPVETSPLGPQPTAYEAPAESDRRGGPVHRETRSNPRPRHQLRPISEMPEPRETTPLHIDKKDLPDQFDLQWVTSEVLGQPQSGHRMRHEQRGWVPVHGEDFDGKYDGWFLPKGHQGEIKVDGMVLMARDARWSEKARAEDQRNAQAAVRVKQEQLGAGQLPGVNGADHSSARSFNHLRKRTERLDVPNEGVMD